MYALGFFIQLWYPALLGTHAINSPLLLSISPISETVPLMLFTISISILGILSMYLELCKGPC